MVLLARPQHEHVASAAKEPFGSRRGLLEHGSLLRYVLRDRMPCDRRMRPMGRRVRLADERHPARPIERTGHGRSHDQQNQHSKYPLRRGNFARHGTTSRYGSSPCSKTGSQTNTCISPRVRPNAEGTSTETSRSLSRPNWAVLPWASKVPTEGHHSAEPEGSKCHCCWQRPLARIAAAAGKCLGIPAGW